VVGDVAATGGNDLDRSTTLVAGETRSSAFDGPTTSTSQTQTSAEGAHSTLTPNLNPTAQQMGSQGTEADQTLLAIQGPDRAAMASSAASTEPVKSAVTATSGGKASVIKSAQSSSQSATRSALGAGGAEALQHGSHAITGESTSPALDATALARDPANTHGAANVTSGVAGNTTGSPSASTAHDTFAALDAGTNTGTTTWIHAGAQRAEAGYQDPSLGWVGVRAELSGGGVHAALVPGSADAAQALGGHLAGLNNYLEQQHTPVASLTMAASADGGTDRGVGQGTQQQAGQNGGQGANSESQTNTMSSPSTTVASRSTSAETGGSAGGEMASAVGGRYVSVMA
jgi:hypothetical protein